MNRHAEQFSHTAFLKKVGRHARAAGRSTVGVGFTLYYCLADSDTPMWARNAILGALGYFILPIDTLPDFIPLTGYTDDLGVLTAAAATVVSHIKPAHREQAHQSVDRWLGPGENPS